MLNQRMLLLSFVVYVHLSDFEYEFQRALFAKYLDDDIETVFIMTNNKYSFVSSTGIRELAKFGGKLDGLVPDDVKEKLENDLIRSIINRGELYENRKIIRRFRGSY